MLTRDNTNELLTQLLLEKAELEQKILVETEECQKWRDWADLVTRLIRNDKVSPHYKCLYISLFDTYPPIIEGKRAQIQVHELRANAGWMKEKVTGNFLKDLETIGAIEYDSGTYQDKVNKRPGYVKGNIDVFPYPESFDMQNLERKRKAKEAEEERRNKIKHQLQILQCEMCGSASIVNDVIAKCKSCGHVHDPILDVPSALITIEAEVVEIVNEEDEFLDSQAPAPRPAPVTINALPLEYSTHPPESLQRPDDLCKLCKRTRRECYVPVTDAPGIWTFSCM